MGLSVAFDLATLMGYDTDAPEALGEFGKCGVAVSSLKDMELLFDGIPLGEVSTSMTTNSPAAIMWAFYIATAEKQGVPKAALRGTLQNDILKEYIAQKEFIFPPKPSMRLVTDTVEFGTKHLPQWNTISISGYHIREAGSTAVQELAFTLADGLEYVRWALERGMDIDDFAPRLSFFFNVHNDFFEEIAKLRAARRIWAREMRETFGAKNPRSWLMRFTCRYDCPTHSADHRGRKRRHQHDRPARRQLFPRNTDQPDRSRRLRVFPACRGFWRRSTRYRGRLFPERNRGFGLSPPAGTRYPSTHHRRRERLCQRGATEDSHLGDEPTGPGNSARPTRSAAPRTR
jgi:hypothetical protein